MGVSSLTLYNNLFAMKYLIVLSFWISFLSFSFSQTVHTDLFADKLMKDLQTELNSTGEIRGKIEHNTQGQWVLTQSTQGSAKTGQALTEEWVDEEMAAVKTVLGYVAVQNRNCHLYSVKKEGARWNVIIYPCL